MSIQKSHEKVPVGGIQLNVTRYEDDAAGTDASRRRSLLLLHGWPNAGGVWEEFAGAMLLADPGYRLFAPDLRGFGDSDKPDSGYDCATFADDAATLAQTLFGGDNSPGGWTLVGHSMSGKIAQIVASRRPAGLRSLILLTPTPLRTDPLPDETKAKLSADGATESGVRAFITSLPAHPLPDATVDALVREGLRAAPAAWSGWIDTMREEDFSDAAATIATPTLVVAGGKDARLPPAIAQTVADGIVGARLETLPGSGHLPHREEPNALAAIVVNFLDGTLPPPSAE